MRGLFKLTVILGATTYAASAVLAAFTGGMALGNFEEAGKSYAIFCDAGGSL
ncbi:MAG: hypothetical protein ACUVXI_15335 [bacterium]